MLTIKDIIYIITYFISIISVYFAARGRLANLENDSKLFKKILYKERGSLNLIDHEACKKNRDEVFSAIRRTERAMEMFADNLKDVNKNTIEIRMLLDILLNQNGIKKPKQLEINGD